MLSVVDKALKYLEKVLDIDLEISPDSLLAGRKIEVSGVVKSGSVVQTDFNGSACF